MIKKILLVEHNPSTIDTITETLYQDVFDITVAGDAEIAKKLLAKHQFHMVITEALLPKSHGFVLSRYISENYPNIKIIIISGKLKKRSYKREAMENGACEFLEKPLNVIRFKKKVLRHLKIREKRDTGNTQSETTNINVIPLLADLTPPGDQLSEKKDFEDIIKDIKNKENDPFEINLD